jgi:hypothetical protein
MEDMEEETDEECAGCTSMLAPPCSLVVAESSADSSSCCRRSQATPRLRFSPSVHSPAACAWRIVNYKLFTIS